MGKPKHITKKDLVTAAKSQLLKQGQGKITLKNVAETAGVTQGVVYYHFKTKDQLLISLLQDFIEGIEQFEERGSIPTEKQGKLRNFLREEAYKAQVGAEQNQLLFELAALALHQREMKSMMTKSIQQRIEAMSELVDGNPLYGRLLTAIVVGLSFQSLFDPSFNQREAYEVACQWFEEKK